MKVVRQKLNLDRPAVYQIKVPGRLDENLSDWVEEMTITVEREDDGSPITKLTRFWLTRQLCKACCAGCTPWVCR